MIQNDQKHDFLIQKMQNHYHIKFLVPSDHNNNVSESTVAATVEQT
jgi:hypothetical protein